MHSHRNNQPNTMNHYLLVAVSGTLEIEKWITADNHAAARKAFWKSLTEEQKNSTESIECVDVQYHTA